MKELLLLLSLVVVFISRLRTRVGEVDLELKFGLLNGIVGMKLNGSV